MARGIAAEPVPENLLPNSTFADCMNPALPDSWGMDMYYGGSPYLFRNWSTWSPVREGFHDRARFGVLTGLGAVANTPFRWVVDGVSLIRGQDGSYRLEGRITTRPVGHRRAILSVELADTRADGECALSAPEAGDTFTLRFGRLEPERREYAGVLRIREAGMVDITMSLTSIPPGVYEWRVEAFAEGEASQTARDRLTKLPPSATDVRLDRFTRGLTLNRTPYFPVFNCVEPYFATEDHLRLFRNQGFNTLAQAAGRLLQHLSYYVAKT
jgi:hypothetical protein